MHTLSIINTKGGVGKTVTTVHLGAALASAGQRVLLIDIDLQHGLSTYFNIDAGSGSTISDVIMRGVPVEEAAQVVRENLLIVPATAAIETAEVELSGSSGSEMRLRRALNRYAADCEDAADWVLIDCPSGYGALTRNALTASRGMIVPVNSEPASAHCAASTIAAARELAEYHERDLALVGVLMTRFRNTNSARATLALARAQWGQAVFETTIRQAERINDLGHTGETLSEAGGAVASDYAALAQEVVQRVAQAR